MKRGGELRPLAGRAVTVRAGGLETNVCLTVAEARELQWGEQDSSGRQTRPPLCTCFTCLIAMTDMGNSSPPDLSAASASLAWLYSHPSW